MNIQISIKTVRRLFAAEGYLELGMPAQAISELDAIDDPGPLAAQEQFLRGEALMAQERYRDAIVPLHRAAIEIPAPYNCTAWKSLGKCFRRGGEPELAAVVELFSDSPPETVRVVAQFLTVTLELQGWTGEAAHAVQP